MLKPIGELCLLCRLSLSLAARLRALRQPLRLENMDRELGNIREPVRS